MRYRTLKLATLAVIFTLALVMGGVALGQISATNDYMVEFLADIADHPGYLVRDTGGYIGVFYEGRGYPVFITNIPLATLRERDRTDVERGISVPTREALLELLEDLGS